MTSLIAAVVLATGCSRKMVIRFYPSWSSDMVLSEVWGKSSTSLTYESLDSDSSTCEFRRTVSEPNRRNFGPSDFKRFTGIVCGRLPLGDINVGAILLTEGGTRRKVNIEPSRVTCDDPKADFLAFEISQLNNTMLFALPMVVRGRYYVFLEKDGKELCGSDLTIR